jgi:hypothetical protein
MEKFQYNSIIKLKFILVSIYALEKIKPKT